MPISKHPLVISEADVTKKHQEVKKYNVTRCQMEKKKC